jgi:hypothetical protein
MEQWRSISRLMEEWIKKWIRKMESTSRALLLRLMA